MLELHLATNIFYHYLRRVRNKIGHFKILSDIPVRQNFAGNECTEVKVYQQYCYEGRINNVVKLTKVVHNAESSMVMR